MSRLDSHVAAVQNKLALGRFLGALGWSLAGFGACVWVAIVIDRVFRLTLPRVPVWFWSGLGAAAVAAIIYAVWRRPSAHDAAVRIDERLNTKDKFATALHVRRLSDPFAHAALLDAERTADSVSLHKRFPLAFPKSTYATIAVALVALATWHWLSPMDLFGREQKIRKQAEQTAKVDQAKKTLKDAMAQVAMVAQKAPDTDQIKLAKEVAMQQLNQPMTDPAQARRTAAKALQDINEAIKQQVKNSAKFAEAQQDAKMVRQLQVPQDEKGPVADAQRAVAKGDFTAAVDELTKLSENFDKMDKKDQEKAAQQMQNLANQLKQLANNPNAQKQIQDQLQQMGLNQQQAQQAQDLMRKAAQGDKDAQQQMQQMAQQAMQQMNNGQGPTPQQQQAIQQMVQQMQAQANAQNTAQNMQQAAQQMAKAMQQAANPQQGGQQGLQGQGQKQQQQQAMQQAMQGMQQQLGQMSAAAQDAEQIAGAQAAAAQAADQAMNAMNGNMQGNQQNNGGGQWQGQGDNQQAAGQMQPWNGQANDGMGPNPGGMGAGDRSAKTQAPYAIKQEMSPSKDDEKGRILMTQLVKGDALKGESKEQLKEITEASVKNAADEVDQDRVSRQAQKVVRDYFSSMQQDAGGAAAPTTAPSK
jgi:hypothetical protein